jgi:hypothetical protein
MHRWCIVEGTWVAEVFYSLLVNINESERGGGDDALKKQVRVAFFVAGVYMIWLTVYFMLSSFYTGVVEVLVAIWEGGTYRPALLSPILLAILSLVTIFGMFLIAIALTEKE